MRIMKYIVMLAAMLAVGYASAQQSHRVVEYVNKINPKQSAHMAQGGIIVVGKAPTARALSTFNAQNGTSKACVDCCSFYRSKLDKGVNVYLLAIPSAVSFYTPDSARQWTRSEAAAINAIYAELDPNVIIVDVYSALAQHAHEDIYSRTDHHWAPLGGYYAAEAIAKAAGLPFRGLDSYDRVVVPKYVGSMYSFSKDESIKASPENFVYHKPKGIDYKTTYITYGIAADRKTITSESRPTAGNYFFNFQGGGAYCTFMGTDARITQVKTGTSNGRRMLIVKDSFGNAIPGYLFYTFEEIHVVDFRFFNKNLKTYIESHGITDVVISTNISFACSQSTMNSYKRLLVQ